jgi:hypothetical protein
MILWCVVEGDETEYTSRYKVVKAFASEFKAKNELKVLEALNKDDSGCCWYDVVELVVDMELVVDAEE